MAGEQYSFRIRLEALGKNSACKALIVFPEFRIIMSVGNPFTFLQQVRAEASKVTWPSRKETLVTTGMVFVMVVVAALFFLFVDMILRWAVSLILGLGG
jgi:preprotein translocase subunit SecE